MKTSIRKLGSVLIGLLGLAAGTACGSPDETEVAISVERARALGLDWEAYRDAALRVDDEGRVYYNVEGDLYFASEAGLREHFDSLDEEAAKLVVYRQITTGFEPTHPFPDSVGLVFCVSTEYGSNHAQVVADVTEGMSRWEAVANVRFLYDASQNGSCTQSTPTVDFSVQPTAPLTGTYCGYNKRLWPAAEPGGSQGCHKGALVLDYTVTPGIGTRVSIITHELGHILGFRHEHPWTPGECPSEIAEDEDLDSGGRQLTAYDPASIMHYPTSIASGCGGPSSPNLVLSELDGVGARSIYGMPAAWHAASIF